MSKRNILILLTGGSDYCAGAVDTPFADTPIFDLVHFEKRMRELTQQYDFKALSALLDPASLASVMAEAANCAQRGDPNPMDRVAEVMEKVRALAAAARFPKLAFY